MLYAILCYNTERLVGAWTREQDAVVMAEHFAVQETLAQAGKLGPVVRLLPTTTATTVRAGDDQPLVLDGPFAETKEQLLGFYVVDCATLAEVIDIAHRLTIKPGAMEIRPIMYFSQANVPASSLSESKQPR